MPRIDAPTVAEHRARVQARLIDAAEAILRSGPSQPLTAGAVSAAAGIARNSIYRYVDSVEDLRGQVIARYLPDWLEAVSRSTEQASTPQARIEAWVVANLSQAAATGHGWLMDAARAHSAQATFDKTVAQAHTRMWDAIASAWGELLGADSERVPVAVALTVGVLEAGFRQLDAGRSADLVIDMGASAARALVVGLQP